MKTEWIDGRNKCRLLEDVTIYGYTIPAGFIWDGASIPTFIVGHLFIDRWHHTVRRAGLLHDYMYRKQMDRALADKLLNKLSYSRWGKHNTELVHVRSIASVRLGRIQEV